MNLTCDSSQPSGYIKNYNIGRPIDHIIVIIPTDDPSIF